ncbi:MAG: papain-like cysteine protease family protein, partial [Coriobacteriia bacterium]|nr:papain-like cysteine protease family protein [Coriobacteriia bacterium]
CWAACVKAVYEHVFGRKIALSTVLGKLPVGAYAGATLDETKAVLASLGICSSRKFKRLSHDGMKWQLRHRGPIICGVNTGNMSGHMVVLYGFKGKNVWVMDPGKYGGILGGKTKHRFDEFKKKWTATIFDIGVGGGGGAG